MRRLTAGFNYRGSHIFDTRRRDLLSSSTWKNADCPVVSNFYIILRRTHGDIGPLRICFIRRNCFTAATEFCCF
ncbi:hypothetical protein AVEN_232443-1, partial [Araneus ventricosus]